LGVFILIIDFAKVTDSYEYVLKNFQIPYAKTTFFVLLVLLMFIWPLRVLDRIKAIGGG